MKNRKELRIVYEIVGFLDSIISIASFRESIDYFSIPQFNTDNIKVKVLEFNEAYHPLIKDPITNSITVARGVMITGSNASGKSTFIRTVAINAILAQTIATCLAKEYKTTFFNIFSSMALKDNLFAQESYYIAEIKSLKRIIDALNDDIPCLCFIDEVLRGTNTIERIAASSQVLKNLGESNCICFIATHDIELTTILSKYFDNYHFQEEFTNNEIIFDYKIYTGKASSRNAIKLLKMIGYKDSIINSAEDMANTFTIDGTWRVLQ